MKAIALSDVHGRIEILQKIIKLIHNEGVELALVAGDLTNYGGRKQAGEALAALEGLEVMAIPGNLDTQEVLDFLEEKNVSLHKKKRMAGKLAFAGFGGGLLGHCGEMLSSEGEIEKGLQGLLGNGKNTVLLTHLPPFGTSLDQSTGGAHIGSSAVMRAIAKKQPLLHICGHCHEAFGKQKIGGTTSANVGAVKDGRAAIIDFENKAGLKWIKV
jgi:hypothetical protein